MIIIVIRIRSLRPEVSRGIHIGNEAEIRMARPTPPAEVESLDRKFVRPEIRSKVTSRGTWRAVDE